MQKKLHNLLIISFLKTLICLNLFAQAPDSAALQKKPATKDVAFAVNTYPSNFSQNTLMPALADDPLAQLQGQVPGLLMLRHGGDPLQPFQMQVHGLSSFYGDVRPQIWVDGVLTDELLLLRQEDIDSIAVLRTAAATAAYGEGAGNGVILIKTKAATKKGFSADFNTGFVFGSTAKQQEPMSVADYLKNGGRPNQNGPNANTNWTELVTQNSVSNTYYLALNGLIGNLRVRASGGGQNREGILQKNEYQQLNGRFDVNYSLLKDKLNLSGAWLGGKQNAQPGFVDAMRYALTFSPALPVRSNDPISAMFGTYTTVNEFDIVNPVAIIEQNRYFRETISNQFRFGADAQLSKSLSIKTRIASQQTVQKEGNYYPTGGFYRKFNTGELLQVSETGADRLYADVIGNYSFSIDKLKFDVQAGYIVNQLKKDDAYREGMLLTPTNRTPKNIDEMFDTNISDAVNNGYDFISERNNSGILASWSMDKEGMFGLLGGLRTMVASGSALAPPEQASFPFVQGYFSLSKIAKNDIMQGLSLNASWGKSALRQFERYFEGSQNTDWGQKNELDLGMAWKNPNSKLNFALNRFSNVCTDLLAVNTFFGLPNRTSVVSFTKNTIENQGLELSLGTWLVQKENFAWQAAANFTHTRSKMKEVILPSDSRLGSPGAPGFGDIFYQKGYNGAEIGEFWVPEFTGFLNGNPQTKDYNNNGFRDKDDNRKHGKGLPSNWWAFQNHLKIKDISIDFRLRGTGGHSMVNEARMFYSTAIQGRSENRINSPYFNPLSNFALLTDRDVEKASYIRLDIFQAGYHFMLFKTKAVLYAGGQNLLTISKFSGNDPEPNLIDPGPSSNGSKPVYGADQYNLNPGIERRSNYWPERSYFVRLMANF